MINKFKDFLKKFFRTKRSESDIENSFSDDSDLSTHESEIKDSQSKLHFMESVRNIFSKIKNKKFDSTLSDFKIGNKTGESHRHNLMTLSPNISKHIEKILSKNSRESIHQLALALIIFSITYQIGKIVALTLKGHPAIDSSKDYSITLDLENDFNPDTLQQIKKTNIFRTNKGLGAKKTIADTKCEKAQRNSTLPIKLINTIVLQDSVKSLASVQIRGDRVLQEFREGEQISSMAKIFKISRLEILIKNLESGICESIQSDQARLSKAPISVMSPNKSKEFIANMKLPGIENVGNKFSISKQLLDEKMKDIGAILTQARAIQMQNPDGTLAFKLTEMDPQGIFTYLGLQDQDIITSIDGKPIYDLNEVMGLFSKLKNLDKLQLGIKREGSESILDYNIKK